MASMVPNVAPNIAPSPSEPKPPMAAEPKKAVPKRSEHGNAPPEVRDYHQNKFPVKSRPLG